MYNDNLFKHVYRAIKKKRTNLTFGSLHATVTLRQADTFTAFRELAENRKFSCKWWRLITDSRSLLLSALRLC